MPIRLKTHEGGLGKSRVKKKVKKKESKIE